MKGHACFALGEVDDKKTLKFTQDSETVCKVKLATLITAWKDTLHMGGED
jgi:hypothetical protein